MRTVQTKDAIQQIRTTLLHLLNDLEFHSGEKLAAEFSLSRSAISNHIKALSDLGLEIYSVKGRGYKLANKIELLSHRLISEQLSIKQSELLAVLNLVGSTNDIIKQSIHESPSGTAVLAEAQSAGRGRRGRSWVSPFGSSLYMSMLWKFEQGYDAMTGLSLMVGVVLNNTLQQIGVSDCKLKWPNDVYHDGQKLAGILIEVEGQVGASASAIIGIGINIALPHDVKGIDQAYTDLSAASGASIPRNLLAARLIDNLWQALPMFEASGLKPFLQDWENADLYINKPIKLLLGERSVQGISKGIDENGALLLENSSGIVAYHGGEISVRSA